MVARPCLFILMPFAVATGVTFAAAPVAASDPCSHYAWPNYPAECLASEKGVAATKTARKIIPGSSDAHGIEVRIVVAREQGVAPISAANHAANVVEVGGVATALDPFAGNTAQPVDADPQWTALEYETLQSTKPPHGFVEVTIWRGTRPTAYLVRNNRQP